MTNKEILKKALEKAKANGYHWFVGEYLGEPPYLEVKAAHDFHPYFVQVTPHEGERDEIIYSVEEIIFSHKFAKAFWQDAEWDYTHYLQEMALVDGEEDRIKYLEGFLQSVTQRSMNQKTIKTLHLSDKCDKCEKEPYGWFIENNNKTDFIALCLEHLIDFAKSTERYELKRN